MALTYSDAMVPYFGLYAFTMMFDPDMFWGPNGLGQLPYFPTLGDSTTPGGFFARMVGLGFMVMFLGKTRFGVSDDAWCKSTIAFHVGSLWWFWKLTTAGAGWTPWVWQLQCVLNVVFTAWGVQTIGGVDKLLKQD